MAYDLHSDYQPPARHYISQNTAQSPQIAYQHPIQGHSAQQYGYDSVPGAHDDYLDAPHDQPPANGPRHAQRLDTNGHARQHHQHHQQQQHQQPPSGDLREQGHGQGQAPSGDSRGRSAKEDSRRRDHSRPAPRRPLIETLPDDMPISQDTAFPVFPTKKAVEKTKAHDERSHSRPPPSKGRSRNPSFDSQSRSRPNLATSRSHDRTNPSNDSSSSTPIEQKPRHGLPENLHARHQDAPRPPTSSSVRSPVNARFPEPQRSDHRGPEPQRSDHRGPEPQRSDHRGHEAQRPDHRPVQPQMPDHRGPEPQRHDHRSPPREQRSAHRPVQIQLPAHNSPPREQRHEPPSPFPQSPPPTSPYGTFLQVSRPSTSDSTHGRGQQSGLSPLNTNVAGESAQFNTVAARHQPAVISPARIPQEARISQNAHLSQASFNDELTLPHQPWNDALNKHQSLGDVYDHYYSEPAPILDRDAEIEAAMPDFDKPAAHHKRQPSIDKDLDNLHIDTHTSPPPQPKATYQQASSKLQAANAEKTDFDFGFDGSPQRSATYDDYHLQNPAMAPKPPQHSYSYDDSGAMPGMSSQNTQYNPPYGGQPAMARKPAMARNNDSGYADQQQQNYNNQGYDPHTQMHPNRQMQNGSMPNGSMRGLPPNADRRDQFGGPMPRGPPLNRGQTPSNNMHPNALPGSMPNGPPYRGPTPGGRPPQGMPGMNGMGPPPPRHGPDMRAPSAPPMQDRFASPDMRAPSAPPMQGRFAPPHPGQMNGGGMPGPRFAPDMRAPSAPPIQGGYPLPGGRGQNHAPHPNNGPRDPRDQRRPMPRHVQDHRAPSVPPQGPQGGFAPLPLPERPFGAPLTQQRSAPQAGPGAGPHDRSLGNPNALPAHPIPVRPGLNSTNSAPQQKPVPVRHYRGSSDPSSQPQAQPDPSSTGPVTRGELEMLRGKVDANPNDNKTALFLAKRLVEAAIVLAPENGQVDAKTAAKNSERYVLEAHKRVKKLVAVNYPEAMFYLADCYGSGDLGLTDDPKQAFALYQSAAKAGHGAAAYRTAFCCEMGAEEGGGTKRDYHKAVQWYQRAAQLQDVDAMYKMGIILLRGLLDQQRNVGQAVTYLKRAIQNADNAHAMHELARLHEAGNPDPAISAAVRPDEKYAHKLYTQAAKMGHKNSQFRLGQAFEYGSLGLPVDSRNSIAWYSKAAAQGQHDSELALSGWYLTGAEGILEQSDTEAYLWARKAATSEPPLAKAMYALGYYVENGIGCPASLEEAKRWYSRSASYKFPKAIERLEEIRRGKVGRPQPNAGRLTRSNQKRDEAECVVM